MIQKTPDGQYVSIAGALAVNKIVVGGYPVAGVERVVALLKSTVSKLGSGGSGISDLFDRLVVPGQPADVDLLRAHVNGEGRNLLVLLLEHPAIAFASALANREPLRSVADSWRSTAELLLELYDSDDRRILLFDLGEVLSSPGDFAAELAQTLGLEFQAADISFNMPKCRLRDFYLLLAHRYVQDHPALLTLASKLENKRRLISEAAPEKEVDWARALDEVNAIQDENSVMFDQLHKLQIDFEHCIFKQTECEDTNRGLARELDECKNAKRQLQNVYSSTSWKVTKPIRAVSSVFKRLRGG